MSYQNIAMPQDPNPNKKPIQINLRIFVNPQQNQQPIPIIVHPTPVIPQQNTIPPSHYQLGPHPQANFHKTPIYVRSASPVAYQAVSYHHSQLNTPKQFDRILQNPVHKVGSVQSSKFQTNEVYQTSRLKTSQKKQQNSEHSSQKQPYKPEIIPQTPVKCPICQQMIYKNNQLQHQQYHRSRITNITSIPKYEAKQNNIPIYSKEDLFQILMEYEQRIKNKVIQQINQNNGKKLNPINSEKKIEYKVGAIPSANIKEVEQKKEPNPVDKNGLKEDAFCFGTKDRVIHKDILMPTSHVSNKQACSKQIVSPSISNIRIQDQSECFSQLDLLEAPNIQKVSSQHQNSLELPLSSAQKPTSPQPIPQKVSRDNSNIAEYQAKSNINESSYYRSLISQIQSGYQFSKKKKLPSNNMAYQIIKKP